MEITREGSSPPAGEGGRGRGAGLEGGDQKPDVFYLRRRHDRDRRNGE